MAKRETHLKPPYEGWVYDSKSRGWYDPQYGSFSSAKSFDPPTAPNRPGKLKGADRTWIARRQYDKEFFWTPVKSSKGTDTKWFEHNFVSRSQLEDKIKSLDPNTKILVRAFGDPNVTSPTFNNISGQTYGTLFTQDFADSYKQQNLDLSKFKDIEYYILTAKNVK